MLKVGEVASAALRMELVAAEAGLTQAFDGDGRSPDRQAAGLVRSSERPTKPSKCVQCLYTCAAAASRRHESQPGAGHPLLW